MNHKLFFTLRAIVALALLVGFYAVAVGVAGALLYIPYAELVYAHRLHIKLALFSGLGAFAIIKGTLFVPSPRFVAPGPQITEQEEPRLFALVREVAERMQTSMPSRIFLIPDVNAFVSEIGGFMGFGTERIMGIGVGLLAVDSVSELKATIAHEFGHYAGGDTRLGGLVYRTRSAIASVLANLSSHSLISKPFEWYAALFLRVSLSVSRAQELAADRASVRIAGKAAHLSGLLREACGGVLFTRFVRSEVVPLHEHGFRPDNVYHGFRLYHQDVQSGSELPALETALKAQATHAHDTHPALGERLAYAQALPDSEDAVLDATPAISLLQHPERTEGLLSAALSEEIGGHERAFSAVSWDEVSARVHAPKLSQDAEAVASQIGAMLGCAKTSGEALAALVAALSSKPLREIALKLEPRIAQLTDPETAEAAARAVVCRSLGLLYGQAHVEAGGCWFSPIGRPFEVVVGAQRLSPFRLADEALEHPEQRSALLRVMEVNAAAARS